MGRVSVYDVALAAAKLLEPVGPLEDRPVKLPRVYQTQKVECTN